jgi:acyl-CoA synthetase (AMP-forming)/AMP-acid ligase II
MKHIFGQHKEEREGGTMKLVLAAIHIKASPRAVPLGPAMLAAVLRRTFGEKIQTYILNLFLDQPAVECAQATEEELIGFCKERIGRYKAPKSIDFISALPKTGSGKIEKKKLRDQYRPFA